MNIHRHNPVRWLATLCVGASLLCVGLAKGQASPGGSASTFESKRTEITPPEFVGVDVRERMGIRVPLELALYDEDGNSVTLGQYVGKGKPVILQMGYFGCPKLCSQVAQGTLEALKGVDLTLGEDYTIVYVSIDPRERIELARTTKQSYIRQYTSEGTRDPKLAASGWHFLTGPQIAVAQLAQTVGFQYKWVESAQQYSHPAVLILLAPDGTVTRYLYGVQFDPKVLRMSLVDASKGKIGSIMDKIILWCFHYDGKNERSLAAMRIMRIGGILTMFAVASGVGLMVWRGRTLRGSGAAKPRFGLAAVMAGGTGAGRGGMASGSAGTEGGGDSGQRAGDGKALKAGDADGGGAG